MKKQISSRCILILGMHRSGTSCLTGTLGQNGIFLGNVLKENMYNKKCNIENKEVMKLNNLLLKYNNGSWLNPPNHISWTYEHTKKKMQIIEYYIKSQKIFSIKD
ncbi:MAG: hypothetical protein J7K46_04775, partial [Bacteroidales bacterium]|nr:hypothetical protein [Bacteroidales bacterium]